MTPCPGCSRHVRDGELACPFCGGPLAAPRTRAPIVGRVTRAAVFSAALVACGGKKDAPAPKAGSAEHLDQDFNQLLGSAEGSAQAQAVAIDAAVAVDAPAAIDAGLTDEERTRQLQRAQEDQQRKHQQQQQQQQQQLNKQQIQRQDWHNVAKPYGAPPARRRVV